MVPSIDFLPATYHIRRQREQKALWRRMMMFFFLALVVLGTWQQRKLRDKLESRRDELQSQARGLVENLPKPAQLEQQLKDLETQAQLLTTLELRVPMTRVLLAATRALPELVCLNECHAEVGMPETSGAASIVTPAPVPVATEKPLPFEADLTELHNTTSRSATLLTLSGIAPDDLAISQYLMALRETKLFERVTLVFSGTRRVREENWRSFQVRLQVKNPEVWLDRTPAAADRRVAKEHDPQRTGGASR